MPTVLVVDDEPNIAESYKLWLQDDHDVRVATSGSGALDALDEAVDVVLLDRRMPGLSGDEVLDEIADRDIDPNVVLVTAVDPDFEIVEFEFDTYLPKPVNGEDIVEVVEDCMRTGDYRAPDGESDWPREGDPAE
jgi:DNA-binding response OmpR family regulator